MTTSTEPVGELARIVKQNAALFAKSAKFSTLPALVGKHESPDGDHTVHLVRYWNGCLLCTAVVIDDVVRDWCTGVENVHFSEDGSRVNYKRFVAEDPTMEGIPGGGDRTTTHTLRLKTH